MRRRKIEVVEKTMTKNNIGEVSYDWQTVNTLYTSELMPLDPSTYGTSGAIKDWGFDPSKTLESKTREEAKENTYVRINDEIYHLVKVLPYPRHKNLFFERVDRDEN